MSGGAPTVAPRREPSTELAARAAAFDRVIEALTAVAELGDADLEAVAASQGIAHGVDLSRLLRLRREAVAVRAWVEPADRELNAELEALDVSGARS